MTPSRGPTTPTPERRAPPVKADALRKHSVGELTEEHIMGRFKLLVAACVGAATFASASPAMADPAICHNGVLSDDAGQGCADGLYAKTYGSGGTARASASGICHDGILSNDRGQGCPDGLYERVYGNTATSSGHVLQDYGGGSSNPMVNPYCESSGNSQVWDPSGTYWGKYQFDYSTWVAHGGSPGSYGHAGAAEQDQVAARVRYDAWPNC